jgi:hypothetical protein
MTLVTALQTVVRELEQDASRHGWDRPARLYALVPTSDLLEREPQLSLALADRSEELTAIEQDPLPEDQSLDQFLGGIAWPPEVLGAALVVERIIVANEAGAPEDEEMLAAWAADHPGKQDVRMVVAVLRDGSRFCALRLRNHDEDDAVIAAPDLVPALLDMLAITFAD